MLKINFSHIYPKLWGQTKATLLDIRILDAQAVQMNKDLIEYDTNTDYYPLPTEGKLIQLIFIGNKDIPFCTLRRYTPEKIRYYTKNINELFEVVIDG